MSITTHFWKVGLPLHETEWDDKPGCVGPGVLNLARKELLLAFGDWRSCGPDKKQTEREIEAVHIFFFHAFDAISDAKPDIRTVGCTFGRLPVFLIVLQYAHPSVLFLHPSVPAHHPMLKN